MIAPNRLDPYLAKAGYSGQLINKSKPADAPSNLFKPAPGHYGASGTFNSRWRNHS